MQDNNLISVVRLPNNLFTGYAGTEVGSDLIILQKKSAKQSLTELEELFCRSKATEFNTPSNAFFQDNTRIIHTDRKLDTDPYGKPALIYTHNDGVDGIAKDLKQMLSEDFGRHLDLNLYKGEPNIQIQIISTVTAPIVEPITIKQIPIIIQENPKELKQLSIFDLFENVQEPVAVIAPPKKSNQRQTSTKRRANIVRQVDLFSSVMQQSFTPAVFNGNTSQIDKKEEVIGDLF